jgi:hypothetical protein
VRLINNLPFNLAQGAELLSETRAKVSVAGFLILFKDGVVLCYTEIKQRGFLDMPA